MEYHIPALLSETIDGLNIKSSGVYVDVTFGGGGHSNATLKKLKKGYLLGFDQDEDAEKNAPDDERFIFVRNNYRFIKNYVRYCNFDKVDGILADLGVSFHHFDTADRGFSFRFNEKLDMRMDKDAELTAQEIVNSYTREKLIDLFYQYGEINNAKYLTEKIIYTRTSSKIVTCDDLRTVAMACLPNNVQEKKYLAQIFQALRIEVNDEIRVLKELLRNSLDLLNPGGRLVIITYHSLEDRLVKQFMKTGDFTNEIEKDFFGNSKSPFKLINKKVIVPSEEEIAINPRSRSAKLRIAEKI
ncbi:MAG: 16S rRNA (cytosine(1402)-N(4))-methyltransferase RsmH [Bacteroidales bacterium]|nr:16S rRNA (cytosine(1402)-N(4))-methyltransferase RsmH [Bacteroidales bacterium]